MIHSYSSPFNLGHAALDELFDGVVTVQEKIDGSQFSFGAFDGRLFCRSRNQQINLNAPGMFKQGVETAKRLFAADLLMPGWTYRGEYLQKPKHNTLAYSRVPAGHIILFDVDKGDQRYRLPELLETVAGDLGLESAPIIATLVKRAPSIDELDAWLTRESILGGCKIEGVVFKNYNKFGPDKKVLMGKYVSADFKEAHSSDWKKRHPSQGDIVSLVVEQFGSEARWRKAIQHLEEAGELKREPADIGPLLKEINDDVLNELADEMGRMMVKHFWKDISRGMTRGFPEWYKQQLAEAALTKEA